MATQAQRDTIFVLEDIKAHHGRQSTWDWKADYRFARYAKDQDAIETLEAIFKSYAPGVFMINAFTAMCTKIKRRRLAALRHLKKLKILYSQWSGFWLYGSLTRTNEYYVISMHPWTL